MQELMLGVLLILTVTWLVVRIRQNKAATKTAFQSNKTTTGAYHAVAITYSEKACDAAKALTGRRFLANAAPRLPLPECNALECRCKFTHYKDRRTGRDRRSPFAAGRIAGGTGSFEAERRERQDRRHDDDEPEW